MKKVLMLLIAFSGIANAQFHIQGTIENYNQKPVMIKIYDNGSERVIHRTETDAVGNFSYNYPNAYTGKVIFELTQGAFEALTANSDIQFTTDLNDPAHKLNFKDPVNLQIRNAFELEDKKALKDYTLLELKKLYQPQDEFYKAIDKEIARIEQLQAAEFTNDAIAYYVSAKNDIAQYNGNKLTQEQILSSAKNHLIMDNMFLENFGLLQDYLSTYISYSITGATSKDQAGTKIEAALDQLLSEAQTDTSRGQAILTSVIPLLEGNGFNELSAKYIAQAESLTCEITPELKELIEGKNNVQIGSKVPDIDFGKKINGAVSLYKVKADQKLLIFWASWCPHCMNELPHIKSFYDDFKAKGGEIIAISLDMERQSWESAIAGTEWINFSDLMKWESPLVGKFGITATPTMILLDKDNRVLKTGSRISEFL